MDAGAYEFCDYFCFFFVFFFVSFSFQNVFMQIENFIITAGKCAWFACVAHLSPVALQKKARSFGETGPPPSYYCRLKHGSKSQSITADAMEFSSAEKALQKHVVNAIVCWEISMFGEIKSISNFSGIRPRARVCLFCKVAICHRYHSIVKKSIPLKRHIKDMEQLLRHARFTTNVISLDKNINQVCTTYETFKKSQRTFPHIILIRSKIPCAPFENGKHQQQTQLTRSILLIS